MPGPRKPSSTQKDAFSDIPDFGLPGSLHLFSFVTWVCLCEQKFQEIEEAHLRQMKQLIKGYSHSVEDTHVQVGQVG